MSYIRNLLDEFRLGSPVAAEELADFVEHALEQPAVTVAIAFGLRDEELNDVVERHVRNGLIRSLQNFLGEGLSLRAQAEAIRQKTRRYRPRPSDCAAAGERGLLWQLDRIGSLDLGGRQIRRILGGR